MEGGFTTDALIDMTGGIEEAFELNNSSTVTDEFKQQIKRVLWQAYLRKSMIGCSITVIKTNVDKEMIEMELFRLIQKSPKLD